MKNLLFCLLLCLCTTAFSQTYVTITDKCPTVEFYQVGLVKISTYKKNCKVQLTSTAVQVTVLNSANQAITWNASQAAAYGYTLTSLYTYILNLLKTTC